MEYVSSKYMFDGGECICIEKEKSLGHPTHTHEFIEIVYIKKGEAKHFINDICYEVKKGDLLFINYGKTHSFSSENEFEYYNILLTPEFISHELTNSRNAMDLLSLSSFDDFSGVNDEPKITLSGSELIFIEELINEMKREYTLIEKGYTEVLKCCITVLLIHIFRKMNNGTIFDNNEKIPSEILEYIDNNYNEKITINDLAKRCYYNPSYFSRIFSEVYGMTITEYISEKRFKKACELLRESDMTIDEIARISGYRDTAAIFRHFKKKLGITPKVYRQGGY